MVRPRRASMSDVGRRAGVSAQTVSRYFNDGYVSAQARSRIEEAVAELGYVRNRLPVQMRRQRTDTIGVILFGPLNYGNSSIMTGIYRRARAVGQTVMTTHMEEDPAASPRLWEQAVSEIERFLSLQVDALIIGSPYASLAAVVRLVGRTVPVVCVSEPEGDDGPGDPYSRHGAREVVSHLVGLGHRRILHVAGPLDRTQGRERLAAYREVLAEAGLVPLPVLEAREWNAAEGGRLAGEVDPASFTAVFAANDDLALGFMSTMYRRGLRVPRDYAIAGYDDMPQSCYYIPALTTLHVDFDQIGEAAVRRAVAAVNGEEPALQRVPTRLVVRASTVGEGDVRLR